MSRRAKIIIRYEITAARAEVIKFADMAKRLDDSISVFTVAPSTNKSRDAKPSMRLPSRNSRARLPRARLRLPSQRQGALPAIPEETSEKIIRKSLPINDPQYLMLRNVSTWHHESNASDIVSPVFEDITLPPIHVKGLLGTAIDNFKL